MAAFHNGIVYAVGVLPKHICEGFEMRSKVFNVITSQIADCFDSYAA
jgi:hypothetical protein